MRMGTSPGDDPDVLRGSLDARVVSDRLLAAKRYVCVDDGPTVERADTAAVDKGEDGLSVARPPFRR